MNVDSARAPSTGWFCLKKLATIMIAATLLGGCGPRTLRSWFFPETYTVSSTIEFRMPDGSLRAQTQRYRCKIIDTTDAINGSLMVEPVGDRHWIKYPNGSILIVGALQPCLWTTPPERGLTAPAPVSDYDDGGYSHETQTALFDNSISPSKVSLYRTYDVVQAGIVIASSPTIFTGRKPSAPGLKRAFPGIESLILTGGARGGGGWHASDLKPQHFSGITVRVFKLNEGTDCKISDDASVVEIGQDSPCRDVRTDCDTPEGDFVCAQYIRNMDTVYDYSFENARVLHEKSGDPGFRGTYFSPELIMARAGITESEKTSTGWRPKICYKTHCMNGGGFKLYDRENQTVLTVWVGEISFDPSEFTPSVKGYID